MKHLLALLPLLLALFSCSENESVIEHKALPRTIVTTDGEVDDYDSFVRLLMYSNEMDIKALVYSSSCFHWAGDGNGTLLVPENRYTGPSDGGFPFPEVIERESYRWIGNTWMEELIDKYAEVYPNLLKHDKLYPAPEYLQSIIRTGNIRVEGDMSEPTDGSEFIKQIILDEDPSPLYVQIWGGTNTLARALLSIEEEYKDTENWESIYESVSEKVVVYIILDQDGTYKNYIEKSWPDMRILYNRNQFFSLAYIWQRAVPDAYRHYLSGSWFAENINFGHGPLAASYLGIGDGHDLGDPEAPYGRPEMAEIPGNELHDFISEGDSPSYFYLFDWGLRSLEHPEWGGLGGRFQKVSEDREVYCDPRQGDFNEISDRYDTWYPQTRWVKVLQNDFASRADWCVYDYDEANHRPVAEIKGEVDLFARAGQTVTLKASVSDPDGDELSMRWWQYKEAGTSECELTLRPEADELSFIIPEDAVSGTTLHIILEVTDNGSPELTSFQRAIITIK